MDGPAVGTKLDSVVTLDVDWFLSMVGPAEGLDAEGPACGLRVGSTHGRRVGSAHGRRVGSAHGRRVDSVHGRSVGARSWAGGKLGWNVGAKAAKGDTLGWYVGFDMDGEADGWNGAMVETGVLVYNTGVGRGL